MALRLHIIAFVFLPLLLSSQPDTPVGRDPFLLGARLHRGFIIPHSRDIINVSNSNPFGIEISAQWLLHREKYTRNSGVIAKRGFVLSYINFDNPEVLGQSVTFAGFVEPMIRPWGRFYGSVQMGLGISYLSKVYDAETNPTNLFFSFPLSFLAMTNAYLHYKASPHWEISAGFNYNHISNGGMKLPNKGMNFPTWNAGFNYYIKPVSITRPPKNDDWKAQPRHYAYLLAIGTLKTATANDAFPENKMRWQLGGQAIIGRRIGRMSGLSVGTEWVHDGFAQEMLRREGLEKSAWKGSILAGHDLLVNRIRFTIHIGAYVFNPSGDIDPVYQRYGIFYRFGKNLLVGSTLKAHRHVADVFDVRVGWVGLFE
ncbi:MAG: acyloxyacyl hydrolase [Saprospiraceae bacterium]|nr:acyloxyacyl hydrolase [Saprospiraceae bacterium]